MLKLDSPASSFRGRVCASPEQDILLSFPNRLVYHRRQKGRVSRVKNASSLSSLFVYGMSTSRLNTVTIYDNPCCQS